MRTSLNLTLLVLTLVLSGCVGTMVVDQPQTSPPPTGRFVPKENPTRAVGWENLSQPQIRNRLTSQQSIAGTYQEDSTGRLSYFGAGVSASKGRYVLITEYQRFESRDDLNREGVAVRVSARIETLRADVKIGDLWAVAAEVSNGRAKGELSVEVIGIRNVDILFVPSFTIDQTAVMNALQEQNRIIAKLANKETEFDPHVLATAVRPQSSAEPLQAVGDGIDAGSFSYSVREDGTYPGATAVQEKDTVLYHVAQHFNKVFARVPVVVTSVTGQHLRGGERFEVHPVGITPEGFDIELQVWREGSTPDIITVSWIAFDKEQLGGLEARLAPAEIPVVEAGNIHLPFQSMEGKHSTGKVVTMREPYVEDEKDSSFAWRWYAESSFSHSFRNPPRIAVTMAEVPQRLSGKRYTISASPLEEDPNRFRVVLTVWGLDKAGLSDLQFSIDYVAVGVRP